jgi:ERCC4-type nuclease
MSTEKQKEYNKRYRDKNKEKRNIEGNVYSKQWYLANKEKRIKYLEENKEEISKKKKELRKKDVEKTKRNDRKYQLKQFYDITPEQYTELYNKQNGCCAICGKNQSELKKALGVDHNHTTGKIRGLLCFNCNITIGKFNDDINMLILATNYLKEYEEQ